MILLWTKYYNNIQSFMNLYDYHIYYFTIFAIIIEMSSDLPLL